MTDTTIVTMPPAPQPSYVDWGPVFGGAFIASALSFVLLSFGTAAGVGSVSPYSWNNPSVTTLSVVAVAWFIIVMIGTFLVGGYFAGRMRRGWGELSNDERETRDGAHGLLVWGVGVFFAVLLGFLVAVATASGAVRSAASAATAVAQGPGGERVASAIDTMLRPANPADPNRAGNDPRAEIGRMLSASALRGEITNEDRTYMARLVSANTGVPEDEARRRVDTTIESAKKAVDQARKMAAILAFLIGASTLCAAGAAYWGATVGGQHRDQGRIA